jgi:hypothetical protein
MARQAARILVEIWSDDDFIALDEGPQFRYLFLLTQPDLDHTGVISLRDRRWAKKSADVNAKRVMAELEALTEARFVILDEDHEELLIRSFMRRDQVYRQPNILRSAVRQLASVSSPILRAALAVEVDRIAGADDIPDGSLEPLAEMRQSLVKDAANPSNVVALVADQGNLEPNREGYGEGFPEPFGDGYALTPGDGKGLGDGPRGVGGPGEGGNSSPTFDDFWEVYPRKAAKKGARAKWDIAVKKAAPADIIAGAERYRDDPNRTAKYTKHPTTWLNQGCWEDEPIPGNALVPADSSQSVTDQRVAGWMVLSEQMGAALWTCRPPDTCSRSPLPTTTGRPPKRRRRRGRTTSATSPARRPWPPSASTTANARTRGLSRGT